MTTRFGYTLMTEQSGPRDLVRYAAMAEDAGFDFELCSDHYSPLAGQPGDAPYAWSVLGAVAQATERVELMTDVTCPTMRYHPAVVAQMAATMRLLAGELLTYDGAHFRVDAARLWDRLWDLPDDGVPIAVAVSGAELSRRFAAMGG